MPNLTVRNIPERTYRRLKAAARGRGRSLNAQILALFADQEDMAQRRASAARAMKKLDRLQKRIALKYPNQPDSADLIREDRDSR